MQMQIDEKSPILFSYSLWFNMQATTVEESSIAIEHYLRSYEFMPLANYSTILACAGIY